MRYGAKMLQWAPFAASNPEPAASLPRYGTPENLGELNEVQETLNFNEASAAGNNDALARFVNEFRDGTLAVSILDVKQTTMSHISGAQLVGSGTTDETKDLAFGAEDNAPYGGMAFYVNELMEGNVKKYRGVYYPKVKAMLQGETYNTKGQSITLTAQRINFRVMKAANEQYRIFSPYFATAAEAEAWVNAKIVAATSGGGTNEGS